MRLQAGRVALFEAIFVVRDLGLLELVLRRSSDLVHLRRADVFGPIFVVCDLCLVVGRLEMLGPLAADGPYCCDGRNHRRSSDDVCSSSLFRNDVDRSCVASLCPEFARS